MGTKSPLPKTQRKRVRDAVRTVRGQTREPALPSDADESSDSQVKGRHDTQGIGRKAFDDVQAGRVDTDRGPVLEQLGRRLPSHDTPGPAKKRRAR